jgi:hypothetical protein
LEPLASAAIVVRIAIREATFSGDMMARYQWSALLALLIAGCSQLQTFDLPAGPAHTLGNSTEKFGLTLAAELLAEPLAIDYQFGPELKRAGYIPVLIFVENRGAGSFELQRDDFALILENAERFQPVSPRQVLEDTRKSPAPALLLAPLIVPPLFVYRDIQQYNFNLARNLLTKSFPGSLRVENGDPALVRALFFKDPGRPFSRKSLDGSVLQLLVQKEGGKHEEPAESPVVQAAYIVGGTPSGGKKTMESTKTSAATRPPRPSVGARVPFTISLSWETY